MKSDKNGLLMKSPSQHVDSNMTLQGRETTAGDGHFTLPRMIIWYANIVAVGTFHEQQL
jgi:hypothetical protein